MKICIEAIHLGRYRVQLLHDDNEVAAGFDGGSALIMMLLTEHIFKPEHAQYQRDQKANSDALGDYLVKDMKDNPKKYLPPKEITDGRD